MSLAVDVSILGDKALERKLRRLEPKVQKAAFRKSLRDSAKRIKGYVIQNISGGKVHVRDGDLLAAFSGAKIRGGTKRGFTRIGMTLPDRGAFGIAEGDKHFWPFAVEYGHVRAPAHPYLRPAVDEHKAEEFRTIARDMGREIQREAMKK